MEAEIVPCSDALTHLDEAYALLEDAVSIGGDINEQVGADSQGLSGGTDATYESFKDNPEATQVLTIR